MSHDSDVYVFMLFLHCIVRFGCCPVKRKIVMCKTRIRLGRSLFALLPGLFFLSILSSPAPAATPEIEGIRAQIRAHGARWAGRKDID
jgi:hypothetical protein